MGLFDYFFGGKEEEKQKKNKIKFAREDLIVSPGALDNADSFILRDHPSSDGSPDDCLILQDGSTSDDNSQDTSIQVGQPEESDDLDALFDDITPISGNDEPLVKIEPNDEWGELEDDLDSLFEPDPSYDSSNSINQLEESQPQSESADTEMADLLGELGIEDNSQETSEGDLSGLFDDSEPQQKTSIDKIVQTSDRIKELSQNGNFTAALSIIDHLPAAYKKDALYASVALAITQELGKESYTAQSKELLGEMLTKVRKLSSYLEQNSTDQTKSEDK